MTMAVRSLERSLERGLLLLIAGFLFWPGVANAGRDADLPGEEMAWAELLRGQARQAERSARALLAKDPENARAAVCLIESLRTLLSDAAWTDSVGRRAQASARSGIGPLALGKEAHLRRDFTRAEPLYTEALHRFNERGDSLGALVVRGELGSLLRDAGRPDEAAAQLEVSLREAEKLGRPLSAIAAVYGLGYTRIHIGKNEEAASLLARCLQAAQQRDLPLWVGDTEMLLAVLRWYELDLEETIRHYSLALEAYERAGNPSRQAACLRNMAGIEGSRGDLPSAIRNLRRAQALADEAGDVREASICLEHLASMNHALGDVDLASAQWEEAIRMGADLWPPEWLVGTLNNLATVLAARGRQAEALEHLEHALAVTRRARSQRERAEVLTRMAQCLRETGEPERGLERARAAQAVAREWKVPLFETSALVEIGLCHQARGERKEALSALSLAEQVAHGKGFYEIELAIRAAQAALAREVSDYEQAYQHLEAALEIAEGVRRRSRQASAIQQGVFVKSGFLYERTVDLLYELHLRRPDAGYDRKAFDIVQRAKARALLDLLAEAKVNLRFRAGPEYQRREREITARISELVSPEEPSTASGGDSREAEIERLEDELAILEKEVRERDPRFAGISYPRPITLEQVQAELRDEDLLLEYHLGEDASYLLAVSRDSFRFVRLPPRREVGERVRALLPLLQDYNVLGEDPGYFVGPARELHRILLEPVAEDLARGRHLVIAPHGVLHYLPFELLLVEEPDSEAIRVGFGGLPYLIKTAEVRYVPSASVLSLLGRSDPPLASATRQLLLVGNPSPPPSGSENVFLRAVSGGGTPPIASMDIEVSEIERIFSGRSVRFLVGPQATLSGIREAGSTGPYSFVHFATHGVLNERRPAFSGLVLSPDPKGEDDGFLTVGEVLGMDLPCEQVVLSACSSGLGEIVTGEGVVGLTRAFLYAGARRVVAALWEVSGQATARFMREFYLNLEAEGGRGSAQALAVAKRALIQDSAASGEVGVPMAHPYFWAGFVLVGME